MRDVDALKAALIRDVQAAGSLADLDQVRSAALGRKGSVTQELRFLKSLNGEARKDAGRVLNTLKAEVRGAIAARRKTLIDSAAGEVAEGHRSDDLLVPGTGGGTGPTSRHPGNEPPNKSPRHSIMTAWFLGPKSEHSNLWQESFQYIFQDYVNWRRNYFPTDPVVVTRERRRDHYDWVDRLNGELDATLANLKAHFPFYSPRYAAHMLSEQTLPSVLGYFAGMLYNPNNVTDEAAPVTVKLELEVGKMIAEMLGFNPTNAWTHICSGGTIANLEALWIARIVQFVPFMIQEYCAAKKLSFIVKMPNGQEVDIGTVPAPVLVNLRPATAAFMLRKFIRASLPDEPSESRIDGLLKSLNASMSNSKYNVSNAGFANVCNTIGKRPVLFVSATAHYSIKKAANVLGYGESAVVRLPTDSRFRVDVDTLRDAVYSLHDDQYIAAVIGIVGTTEEGAVDPIHEIKSLRDNLERDCNRSFWLHIDAAWGGYIRTLFRGHEGITHPPGNLNALCAEFEKAIGAREDLDRQVNGRDVNAYPAGMHKSSIAWNDFQVYKSFLAMADADSVTIDPHKMGYVPYPAGMISFRHGVVTELVEQKAQYISNTSSGIGAARILGDPTSVKAVGPYILEGSKPGAAATACWLAHKTIPLTNSGHGKIVKTTLLNTQRLNRYLREHKNAFKTIDKELFDSESPRPFCFEVLAWPDTNVVIFVAVPTAWQQGSRMQRLPCPLSFLNKLNEGIYGLLSLGVEGSTKLPYGQRFFVSRTRFEHDQYTDDSLRELLERLDVQPQEYKGEGLFVLRSTVMNPFYFAAREVGQDYLFELVKELHVAARTVIMDLADDETRKESATLKRPKPR